MSQLPNIIGVFRIYNIESGYSFIGQSKNINKRITTILHNLEYGTHSNETMLSDYKTYGISSFKVEILLETAFNAEHAKVQYLYHYYHQDRLLYNSNEITTMDRWKKQNKLCIVCKEK